MSKYVRSFLQLRRSVLALTVVCALLSPVAGSQRHDAADAERSFPSEQLMTIGVYYYPEAWPEEQWERDIQNIKRFGFEFIHVGEFAWAFMEPEEGKYDFSWLERVVELARRHGLKVVLCTPTPTPPSGSRRNIRKC